ncbi:MAG: iron ABC transporter permease [Actinomycetota bacterium]|nr:iron ABC transporter permease [Actinomycetota bacterium]
MTPARATLAGALGLAALALTLLASVALGAGAISLGRIVSAYTAYDGSREHIIVTQVRAPRAVLAAAVGAALAVAGAIMQAVSRNPLAEPGLLGISWGAAAAAVAGPALLGVGSLSGQTLLAMGGAALAGAAVVALGLAGGRGLTPPRLVIAGAAISALPAALVEAMLVLDAQSLASARRWLGGSLLGRDAELLITTAPYLAAGLLLAVVLARPLTALGLGDDIARGLGQRTGRVKAGAAAAVVLLAGAAVAIAGPILLVGLAVPHLARAVAGQNLRRALPAAALLGALLVVVADLIARLVVAPEELPVGIVTALVGAPVLVRVVRRR